MENMLEVAALFNKDGASASLPYLLEYTYPWEALPAIKEIILKIAESLDDSYERRGEDVWISKAARVAPTASIAGPTVIMEGAEIRHCAYIRGSALVGRGAVVGNSCELKNCILFDRAQVPHFNYVGDSILGEGAHMGAGAVTSNLKSDKSLVTVLTSHGRIETGLKKFGAILGDGVEVGCNTVLCPGAVIGRGSTVYPLSRVRGFVPEGCIYKGEGNVTVKR